MIAAFSITLISSAFGFFILNNEQFYVVVNLGTQLSDIFLLSFYIQIFPGRSNKSDKSDIFPERVLDCLFSVSVLVGLTHVFCEDSMLAKINLVFCFARILLSLCRIILEKSSKAEILIR